MREIIYTDYTKIRLFPAAIEDWIPADHPARFIREFVESLDFDELGFQTQNTHIGGRVYSNELMLKLVLYGKFHGQTSTRILESMCYNNIGVIWLLTEARPDHNTINRFIRNNSRALEGVLRATIKKAAENDLIDLAVSAVDGTKILADVNQRKKISRYDIREKLMSLTGEDLDGIFDKFLQNNTFGDGYSLKNIIDKSEENEDDDHDKPDLPQTSTREAEKDGRAKGETKVFEEKQSKSFSKNNIELKKILDTARFFQKINSKYLHLTDPEARTFKTSVGFKFAYNAQLITDSKAGFIIAADVLQNSNDSVALTSMAERAKINCGKYPSIYLADRGYFSGREFRKADEMGLNAFVNQRRIAILGAKNACFLFGRESMEYDSENDSYKCRHGGILEFRNIKFIRNKPQRIYRCNFYKSCDWRCLCSPNRWKRMSVSADIKFIDAMKEKVIKPENSKLLSRRKAIVEKTFGTIKSVLGLTRWSRRGLEQAKAEWNLFCAIFNLRKLYNAWQYS